MPRVLRNPQTREFVVEDPTFEGGWRPLSDEEHTNLRPSKVLDEMGVDPDERFTFKNFSRNPAMMAQALRGHGYEVMPYGEGFNFAVRKTPDQPWKVVDPAKGGWAEVWRDVTDLFSDVVGGALVGGATVAGMAAGGPAGGAAAGAGAGALVELGRQAIGQAAGIEGNVQPLSPEVAISTAAGALGPVLDKATMAGTRLLGRAIRGTTTQVARGVEQTIGRITGVKELHEMSIADAFVQRGMAAKQNIRLPRPEEVVDVVRTYIDDIGKTTPPGTIERLTIARDAIVQSEAVAGKRVNLAPYRKQLLDLGSELTPRDIDKRPEARFLREQVHAILNPPQKEGFRDLATGGFDMAAYRKAVHAYFRRLKNADPRVAVRIKDLLQHYAADHKSFVGFAQAATRPGEVTKEFVHQIGGLSGELNRRVRGVLRSEYAQLNDELSRKIDLRNMTRKYFGEGVSAAESRIADLLRPGRSDGRELVKAFDAEFGTNFYRLAKDSALGLQFTPATAKNFGEPTLVPKLSATGQFLSLGVPVSAGAMIGGVPGAVAVGTALGSPKVLVKLAPSARRITTALTSAGTALATSPGPTSPLAKTLAIGALQTEAKQIGKGVARGDKRKRRANLL